MAGSLFVLAFFALVAVSNGQNFQGDATATLPVTSILSTKQLWTPGINKLFANMSEEDRRRYLGSIPMDLTEVTSMLELDSTIAISQNFNAAVQWPQCAGIIRSVRNQGGCGSCWATAAASAMSDLTCIKCNGQYSPYLSEQDLLTCCANCGDCERGGRVSIAFDYWVNYGLVTGGPYGSNQGCRPYTIPPKNMSRTPSCSHSCGSWYGYNYNQDKHKGVSYGVVKGQSAMQQAIYTYGPIVVSGFKVYDDFQMTYKNGIYHHTQGSFKGYHAVKVLGWGEDNGVPYWLAANSWGTDWGMHGFFKIRRGNNECDFETSAIYGSSASSSCFSHLNPSSQPTTKKTHTKAATRYLMSPVIVIYFACAALVAKSRFD